MKRLFRPLLAVLGAAAFLLLWEGVVLVTRPPPFRRVTLAFSTARAGLAAAAILGDRGQVLDRATLRPDEAGRQASLATLARWLPAFQPTIAAVPPGWDEASPLGRLLAEARRDFPGGLVVHEVAASAPIAADEALRRGRRLQDARSVRPAWLPTPREALGALGDMIRSGEMLRHVVASLFRVLTGFALAVALGIPFGLALGSLAWLSSLTNAIVQALRPISPIAWLPVATLALGGGDVAAIFLIFLAAFFPISVGTAAATATLDLKFRRSALNFGLRGLALAGRVVLPAALPSIITALRLALGISWVVVVAAEMLGVESGLGYLVLDARNQLRYDRVVAAMIVIGLIGLALDAAVRYVERGELERRGLVAR